MFNSEAKDVDLEELKGTVDELLKEIRHFCSQRRLLYFDIFVCAFEWFAKNMDVSQNLPSDTFEYKYEEPDLHYGVPKCPNYMDWFEKIGESNCEGENEKRDIEEEDKKYSSGEDRAKDDVSKKDLSKPRGNKPNLKFLKPKNKKTEKTDLKDVKDDESSEKKDDNQNADASNVDVQNVDANNVDAQNVDAQNVNTEITDAQNASNLNASSDSKEVNEANNS